jgi:hypothetical protein
MNLLLKNSLDQVLINLAVAEETPNHRIKGHSRVEYKKRDFKMLVIARSLISDFPQGATITDIMNHFQMNFCMATRFDEIDNVMKRMIEVRWVTMAKYGKKFRVYRLDDKGRAAVDTVNQLNARNDPIIVLDAFRDIF